MRGGFLARTPPSGQVSVVAFDPHDDRCELGGHQLSLSRMGFAHRPIMMVLGASALALPTLLLAPPAFGACGSDTDCAATEYCDPKGNCVRKIAMGGSCNESRTCMLGLCVDGVCCTTACVDQCAACDLPDSLGSCAPATGAPHGSRSPCPRNSPTDLCSQRVCDGITTTKCAAFPGASVLCRGPSCSAGYRTLPATCNGQGACPAPVTKPCAPYVCAATNCGDTCTQTSDCVKGYECSVVGTCEQPVHLACDDDHTLYAPNGDKVDCAPYKCTAAGGCTMPCGRDKDCIDRYACNDAHACVNTVDAGVGVPSADGPGETLSGGCSLGVRSDGTSARSALVPVAAFIALSRRRRDSRTRNRHRCPPRARDPKGK